MTSSLKVGDRVRDIRTPLEYSYGDGVITEYERPDGPYPQCWCVRWDDPGLDDEIMAPYELEVINE